MKKCDPNVFNSHTGSFMNRRNCFFFSFTYICLPTEDICAEFDNILFPPLHSDSNVSSV